MFQIPLTITPRSKPSSSTAKDVFFTDVQTAFISIIASLVPDNFVYIQPPPPMATTGCWCMTPDPPHTWKTCRRWVPQPIISSSASIDHCTHATADETGHLFCFNPFQAAEDYVAWFIHIPGPPETPLPDEDARRLSDWFRHHYMIGETPESEAMAQVHYNLLSRFFVEMRGPPPKSSRFGGWYDAERIHYILNWAQKPIRACMDQLLPAVSEAKLQRLYGNEHLHQ